MDNGVHRAGVEPAGDSSAARRRLVEFVARCRAGDAAYRLTPRAEPTPFATCFAVFCRHLVGDAFDANERDVIARSLRHDVRATRAAFDARPTDKPFRQLLSFALSTLHVLGALDEDPLDDLVREQLPDSVGAELEGYGCLAGRPGSGNQAMFSAIFMLHARDGLGLAVGGRLEEWVGLHLRHMNRFGFWSRSRTMTHLQFQNGYHQYEILEYLGVANPRAADAAAAVASLVDPSGHFAPYPGGGACYDYDAVFVLTPGGQVAPGVRRILERTRTVLLRDQRDDGGFAESLEVRPRSVRNVLAAARHILRAVPSPSLTVERTRYNFALQRPVHDRIHTHWSRYARGWDESDLWDSWFRLLTLARIETALEPAQASPWGFINYPGIGYHASLASRMPHS